jgi:hypothetical protein
MKKPERVLTDEELEQEYRIVYKYRRAFMRKPDQKAYLCEFCLCWHLGEKPAVQ